MAQRIKVPGREESWLLVTKGFQVCLHPVVNASNVQEVAHLILQCCVFKSTPADQVNGVPDLCDNFID